MDFYKNYMIVEPFQLPWLYVSPLNEKGLEYHVTPDLSIQLEGIISGDTTFVISHLLIGMQGEEVNELQAEQIFHSEIMPTKSRERVVNCFRTGQHSCFFGTKQMEYLQQLFEERNFMCYNISVTYEGRKVEDIVNLPPDAFKKVLEAFETLHVQGTFDYKIAREELEKEYDEYFKNNVAKMDEKREKEFRDKLKSKKTWKKIGSAFLSVAAGVGGIVIRGRLATKGGWGMAVLGIAVGTIGVIIEMYGRNELQRILRMLTADRGERGAF